MAETDPQSLDNHRRIIPIYLAVLGIFALNTIWSLYRLVRVPSIDTLLAVLMAVSFVLLGLYARRFALTVQDRVIRLEMQLRLRGLLPPDLQSRIPELTRRQLIALRFASDEELPDLCRAVLKDNITEGKAIKKMIKNWNADHLRA
jgi:uncharacterized membrane protein YciS (DUF1049 family)